MRGYGKLEKKIEGLRLVAQFREVPPGSRAKAAVTAAATAILTTAIGYLVSQGRISPGSDLPALTLALPAVAASYFGITADSQDVVGGSLLARLSLICSGLLSIGSVIVYLMTAHTGLDRPQPYASSWALLGITQPWWKLLVILATFNLVWIFFQFVVNLAYYRSVLSRAEEPWSSAAMS
jgi:hypothetical protein